jgi:uncharacterized membrane protein
VAKLKRIWNILHSSLWFIPSIIVGVALVIAVLLIEIDSRSSWKLADAYPRLFGAGAEGSRGMLEAIASSMITVAGVIFSITIVTLSLASSQYSPRVLRNFMGDRANQIVLGVFVGIFTYCLVVLRTIRGGDEGEFVPSLSVLFGVLLALIGIGFLIFFIHHTATSIQSSSVIASAAEQTSQAIDHLFPQELGDDEPEENHNNAEQALARSSWQPVRARTTGYIESVEVDALLRFASERRVVVRMQRGIGDFIVEGSTLALVNLPNVPDEETANNLNSLYTINRNRTVEQDAAFGIRQIVDIALKALSPGINDTTTAVVCLDYLSAILVRLASRRIETPYRYDAGELRVIAKGPTFDSLLDAALNQIRQNAAGNVSVIIRMLETIDTISELTRAPGRRLSLIKQVALIDELAQRTVESAHDRAKVSEHVARVSFNLEQRV